MELTIKSSTCDNCGGDNATYRVHSDGYIVSWCENCVESYAETCDRCGCTCDSTWEVITNDPYSRYRQTTERWCYDCVTEHAIECESCGDLHADTAIESYELYGGNDAYLCHICIDNEYVQCGDCGCWIEDGDAEYNDRDECYYCYNCADDHRHESDNLASYHHTGAFLFWNADGTSVSSYYQSYYPKYCNRLYLGVELETDGNDDACDLADDIMNAYSTDYVECKEDGSLHDNGVEIVSQPMEAGFHLSSPMWDDIIDIVRAHGGTSHEAGTCGLHIHGSRNAFAEDSVYRLDRLFSRFSTQLVNFSRRTQRQLHWCAIDDNELANISDTQERKAAWRDKKYYAGRYQAVNNTNHNTVEVRLWRGTLNRETLRATIELTAGLMLLCNHISDDMVETVTWPVLKTLVRVALYDSHIPHDDMDAYIIRRGL